MLQNQAEFLKPNSKAYAKSSVIHYLPESKRRREQQRLIGHPQMSRAIAMAKKTDATVNFKKESNHSKLNTKSPWLRYLGNFKSEYHQNFFNYVPHLCH